MPSLEEQFEQAFTEITVGDSGRHLLDAEAVTECIVQGSSVTITLDLPADDTLRRSVAGAVEQRIGRIDGIENVHIRMADQADGGGQSHAHDHGGHAHAHGQQAQQGPQRPQRQTYLENYDAVVAVGSGKGGVGKSTVAVNLAITLQKMGHRVSLFDADIYGPSLPIMMGLRNNKPQMRDDNKIIPLSKYGLDVMSIGLLVEEAAATIWRGPIVHQVIDQMLRDTAWPGGDIMVIDLPPGTGDAQLTLSQVLQITGAVIVSTPQDVALLDALKAVSMFNKVDVPVAGMVENMSRFVCPSCGTETAIFDTGNAERASSQNNVPFLGSIPLELSLREGGDMGAPIAWAAEQGPAAEAFRHIARNLLTELEKLA